VFFSSPAEADQAVSMMDGRLFFLGKLKGKTMNAATWDGKTKFKTGETEEEEQKRLEQWDKWLTGEDEEEEKNKSNSSGLTKSETSEERK